MDGGADAEGNPTYVPDTTECSFDYFGNTMEGRCFSAGPGIPPVCLAACEPAPVDEAGNLIFTDEGALAEVDCVNPNNSCQALDVLAPGVPSVCIPGNTFTEAAQCPSGTHAFDNGDGTFNCVSPSGLACLGKSNLDTAVSITLVTPWADSVSRALVSQPATEPSRMATAPKAARIQTALSGNRCHW